MNTWTTPITRWSFKDHTQDPSCFKFKKTKISFRGGADTHPSQQSPWIPRLTVAEPPPLAKDNATFLFLLQFCWSLYIGLTNHLKKDTTHLQKEEWTHLLFKDKGNSRVDLFFVVNPTPPSFWLHQLQYKYGPVVKYGHSTSNPARYSSLPSQAINTPLNMNKLLVSNTNLGSSLP